MKLLFPVLLFFLSITTLPAQNTMQSEIADSLTAIVKQYAMLDNVKVLKINANTSSKTLTVTTNEILSQMPFRIENVKQIYSVISKITKSKYPNYTIICISDNKNIETLIPNFYRKNNADNQRIFTNKIGGTPIVTNLSRPYTAALGLTNRNIALWQSHGLYYVQKEAKWDWQRARLFQTVEDLFTQSFVLPYLVPMLENAGAKVFLPRERDLRREELIVDNDKKSDDGHYEEHNGAEKWKSGKSGFAHLKEFYVQGENPFISGSYRECKTVTTSAKTSIAEWQPDFPETGTYAVYISYKTVENSALDAHYTVFHSGGKTEFSVNQQLGGGTWIYLGSFQFEKGKRDECRIVLDNASKTVGKTITADAVKIGGGMGNIARRPLADKTDSEPTVSGFPRYAEGARYWLQWAGFSDSIYSTSKGENDYTDDYKSRGEWVNALAGGSQILPRNKGLGIPVDLSFALHTDAGTNYHDSIVGTLAICTTTNLDRRTTFTNGVSRFASRDFADIVQTQVVEDIRQTFEKDWSRRGLWDKQYNESRVPELPAMLLELLAHQNFADMRYAHDPRFKFTVSRAIYKGMLKYIAYNSGKSYVVQPLPVQQFSTQFLDKNRVELRWLPTVDTLESTAAPDKYIIYTRIDDGGFDNGKIIKSNSAILNIEEGKIYSFKIAALNDGGESFPSEILSVYRAENHKPTVLIINGFDRVCAPRSFVYTDSIAGFDFTEDAGVPYIADISFTGEQYEFLRTRAWISDANPGFGASKADFETKIIAGNTFDYPFIHGQAIKAAGFSFVSCSRNAVEEGSIDITNYKIADLILGKQRQTFAGNGSRGAEFRTFSLP
ncbi:MAG: N-acetylmuramoyl-L-alanine amidase, partial [Paludibacter sp.]|nr:N-acetylmuramoyl-L-alanine amidase [Paludibacter sp.]